MSEAPQGGNTDSGTTPPAEQFAPITTQEDLNKVISDRIARERAKFADYSDVKAKAARLDQLEQANQTEAEKAAKKVAELEAELSNTRRDSLRLKVASAHGITDADDIDLFLTGSDEDTLTRQAKRLSERDTDRKKQGNRVPTEGTTPSSANTDEGMREFAKNLFGKA